jgi:hypothetical protein
MTEAAAVSDASAPSPTTMLGIGVVAALALAVPRIVSAAEPVSPLTQGLLGAGPVRDEPRAQRFQSPDGSLRFTLERAGNTALMRIDGQDEVLALKPAPGPRGDEILKTDTGRVLLRVSAMGGVTVYSGSGDYGAPVSAVGAAARLQAPAAPAGGLTAKMSAVERETGRTVGRPISFEAPSGASLTSSAAVGLVADAAERAAEGLAAAKPRGVKRVVIQFGPRPEARLEQDALRVTVTPQLGYAGRPSAEAVKTALSASSR